MGNDVMQLEFGEPAKAMMYLLKQVGEVRWLTYVRDHYVSWKLTGDAALHHAAYTTDGAFCRLRLSAAHGHRLEPAQEAAVNALFHALRVLCYAGSDPEPQSAGDLSAAFARYPGPAPLSDADFLTAAMRLAQTLQDAYRRADLAATVAGLLAAAAPPLAGGCAAAPSATRQQRRHVQTGGDAGRLRRLA